MSKSPLSEFRKDVLKEMGNIGVGNATSALSQLLHHEKVRMSVPEVSFCPLKDIPEIMGGAEENVAAVFCCVPGEVSFYMVFLLGIRDACSLAATLLGEEVGMDFEDAMARSVILEVGNIFLASYLNALSYLTDLPFLPTPPLLAVDMAGAILGTILAQASISEDNILVLKTTFAAADSCISGNVLILPNQNFLDKVISLLINEVDNG